MRISDWSSDVCSSDLSLIGSPASLTTTFWSRPMTKLKLQLALERFDALHSAADTKGKTCKVSRDDLAALLLDHSKALVTLLDVGVSLDEPGFALEGFPPQNGRAERRERGGQ